MEPAIIEPIRIPLNPLPEPMSAPRKRPTSAKKPFSARNPVGETVRPRPAAINLSETASVVVRGFTFRAHRASQSPTGAMTRSRRPSCAVPVGTCIRPYAAARRTERKRCRDGRVTISPTRNAAPARQKTASTRRIVIYLAFEGDELLEDCGAESHHRQARVDEHVPRARVVERVHVAGVDDRDPGGDEKRERDERVCACAPH